MGTHAIGVNRDVPCVGTPDGDMYACGAEGVISLVTLADGSQLAHGGPGGPVVVHMTVCPVHVREVRKWLSRITPEPVETWSTAVLMEHWGTFEEEMQGTPIMRLQAAG